ncbi:polyphosphate kinase 1, partial [Oleiphilus sp. HI0117]
LMQLPDLVDKPELLYPAFAPGLPKPLKKSSNIFSTIKQKDILLHHPFQSFTPVIDFLRHAALDPDVVAIKQTLYRSGANSEIVAALVDAARRGKEVTAVIELRARFDEEENIELASRLQEAGAVVVYGVVGYKTHAKMILVARREAEGFRHYVHLGTGNYHAKNARLYTDYSFMSGDEALGKEVHKIFQQLTGMGKALKIKKLFHAPFTLHDSLVSMIEREANNAKAGKASGITIKVNAVSEPKIIRALYRASQAGVPIKLIVRGICCLRPGLEGISETIEVRSVIGRFLEHTRVYWFHNDGNDQIYGASADWMTRNLLKRVETCFPMEDKKLVERVKAEIGFYLSDNCQSWIMDTEGKYHLNQPAEAESRVCAQQYLLEHLAST